MCMENEKSMCYLLIRAFYTLFSRQKNFQVKCDKEVLKSLVNKF